MRKFINSTGLRQDWAQSSGYGKVCATFAEAVVASFASDDAGQMGRTRCIAALRLPHSSLIAHHTTRYVLSLEEMLDVYSQKWKILTVCETR